MQYWQCKCGKKKRFESGMAPRDCQGCDECGTTYAQSPKGHKPKAPHNFKIEYDINTGKPKRRRCIHCHRGEKLEEIEAS